jgi:hypothetical protein
MVKIKKRHLELKYISFPDIHCLRTATIETLTAFLHMPEGFSTAPVMETSALAKSDPNLCLITRTNVEEIYALDLSRMEQCGVRECQEQVKTLQKLQMPFKNSVVLI